MAAVTVRYFASARAAAGLPLEQATADSVADLRAVLAARHDARFAAVLAASSLLVDGVAVTSEDSALTDGASVDVLPPFAGG